MPRVLALSVSAYWTAFFAMKATAAVFAATGGGFAALVPEEGALAADPLAAVLLCLGAAMSAAMFSWMLIAAAAAGTREDRGAEDVSRLAFGVAVGFTTAILLAAALRPGGAAPGAAMLQFVALLGSYVAVQLEERHMARRRSQAEGERPSHARMMALGAAHTTLLPRLATRRDADTGRGEG